MSRRRIVDKSELPPPDTRVESFGETEFRDGYNTTGSAVDFFKDKIRTIFVAVDNTLHDPRNITHLNVKEKLEKVTSQGKNALIETINKKKSRKLKRDHMRL